MQTISEIREMILPYLTENYSIVSGGVLLLLLLLFYLFSGKKTKQESTHAMKITLMKKAFEVCQEAVMILSDKQELLYVNTPMRELLKFDTYRKEKTLGKNIKVSIGKEFCVLEELIAEKSASTKRPRLPPIQAKLQINGRGEIPVNLYMDVIQAEDESQTEWRIVSIHDLTSEKRHVAQEYRHKLTGLPNQVKALHDISALNAKLHLNKGKMVLMLLNIDNLSVLRSILGNEQTDKILKKFALYLKTSPMKEICMSYHTFYNNFLLILNNVEDLETVRRVAKDIQKELQTFYKVGESRLFLTASIGVSAYPDSGPVMKLFDNASKALNKAEKNGHGRIEFYIPEERKQKYDELVLYNDMHAALEREQFEVYYQPIVNAKNGRVVSSEALIRWHHPEYGMVPPDLFIAVMEKTGFIVELGRFVLNEVLKQQKRWELFKFRQIPVSINLSLIELEEGKFVEYVEQQIAYHKADPDLIRYEITEGLAMQDKRHFAMQFDALKKLGVTIVLDDFGSGYTSYAYLKRFPASLLKIDKVLVDNILTNKDDQYIVKSIIDLGHSLGMKVVIEGIENKEMADLLTSYGCDYFQGFYFSKPLAVFEFQKMLRKE